MTTALPTAASALDLSKARPHDKLRVMLTNGFVDLHVDTHPKTGKPCFKVASTSEQDEYHQIYTEMMGPGCSEPPFMLFDPSQGLGDEARITIYMERRWQIPRTLSARIIGFWSRRGSM